jgi:hypothetical protein
MAKSKKSTKSVNKQTVDKYSEGESVLDRITAIVAAIDALDTAIPYKSETASRILRESRYNIERLGSSEVVPL